MHAVNVAEFLFTAPRRKPELFTPESALAWFNAAEIGIVDILDLDFLQLTAHIRLTERSLSVGDGVSVALASALNIPLVTAERNFKHAHDYARIELIR
jgi:PIN domain nuclease of toxin-antitoxin system